jgi:hypothetical protein
MFSKWLKKHRAGDLDGELDSKLKELVAAVRLHGKKGKLTLEIEVLPKGRQVVIYDKITSKVPEADREAQIYWPDNVGDLHRGDPAQLTIPLAEIADETVRVRDEDTGDIRTIDTSTGEPIKEIDHE